MIAADRIDIVRFPTTKRKSTRAPAALGPHCNFRSLSLLRNSRAVEDIGPGSHHGIIGNDCFSDENYVIYSILLLTIGDRDFS